MDWTQAIARNQSALIRIVAALLAMLGLSEGGVVERLSRPLSASVLRVLQPAESAVRRLIFIAARGLVVKASPARPGPMAFAIARAGKANARVAFQLFDPRKHFAFRRPEPPPKTCHLVRTYASGPFAPPFLWRPEIPAAKRDDGMVSGLALCRRLAAVKAALDDLPRQARRLARSQARQARQARKPVPNLMLPMRAGKPPGHREVPGHEVDDILNNCHALAFDARAANTS